MTRKRFQDDVIVEAIKTSPNIKSVLEKVGMALVGGNYETIKRIIQKYNLDISHFIKPGFQKGHSKKRPVEEVFIENSNMSRSKIKERIIVEKLIPYICAECGLSNVWRDKELSLHLDHINGIRNDNRLENLRFLCPNCHSQTDNYCGKANKTAPREPKLCECGKQINRSSNRCVECANRYRIHKIDWLPPEEILKLLETQSYVSLGKQLGVRDNSIRKYLKKMLGYYPKKSYTPRAT